MIRKNWFGLKSSLFMICLLVVLNGMANVNGNGKVVKEERNISGFKGIAVHNAIHLYLNQGTTEKVTVEAEEEIIHHLYTEVTGGVLKIGIKGSVNNIGEMNVYVTLKEINSLESGSAAKVECEGKIETGELKISTGSASSIKMDLKCDKLEIKSESASKIRITGTAQSLDTESSSASSLDLSELKAEKGEVEASSAASVKVQVTREIDAKASSGAGITITGNPASRNSDSSSGGSVRYR
jgi:hypothetical protein